MCTAYHRESPLAIRWNVPLPFSTPRPFTHDLLANIIEELGGQIDRIEINDLQSGTFYARIHIKQNGRTLEIDSRPSDAIALGIATMVPIFVAEHVLDDVLE